MIHAAGPRLAPKPPVRRDRFARFATISVAAHLLAGAAALAWWLDPPSQPPEVPATVEVLFGDNADQPGARTAASPPAPAVPAQPPTDPGEGELAAGAGPATPSRVAPAPSLPVRLGDGRLGLKLDAPPDENMIEAQADPGNKAPKYPDDAWMQRQRGRVVIRLHIDTRGAVAQAEVLESSGHPALDRAAREALAKWHFIPALRNGVAVPSYRDQATNFVLE